MRYEPSDWSPGDVAFVTTHNTRRTLRMLIVHHGGQWARERLWWGGNGYIAERNITDIEAATALTLDELNDRQVRT